ncbi:MAG: shikimate kinase [Planctomycetota bacterium]|jgi:shikimate kinase
MPKEKSNVVLIGMPGCGKSTIGVLLAKRLQMAFVDTDLIIQKAEAMPLHRLIETRGMDSFCEIECGHNQKLDVSPELCQRLGDLKKRGVVLQPGQTLDDLYEERTPLYERWADVCVDLSGLDHEACVEAIIKKLAENT